MNEWLRSALQSLYHQPCRIQQVCACKMIGEPRLLSQLAGLASVRQAIVMPTIWHHREQDKYIRSFKEMHRYIWNFIFIISWYVNLQEEPLCSWNSQDNMAILLLVLPAFRFFPQNNCKVVDSDFQYSNRSNPVSRSSLEPIS